MKTFALVTLTLFFSVGISFAQDAYLIKAGKLYDAENNIFLKNQEIFVEGNRIKKVGQGLN